MNKKNQNRDRKTKDLEMKDPEMDFRKIMKDIELLGSSHMTWKEKKELENKKVVALGGKPPKKQRLPLSVAKVPMKRQKEREQKMQQERAILGRFGGKFAGPKREVEKRRPEDMVLKATGGRFRNGILDVKHLVHPTPSRGGGSSAQHMFSEGKNKGKRKQNSRGKKKGGKKGGNKKRH